MRIMDGTTKQGNYLLEQKAGALNNPAEAIEQQKIKRRKLEANEEDLRKYEEQIFIENIVEGSNFRNKREFFKEFTHLRSKAQRGYCPYYNGGEKRIWETELNINPHFEKMAKRVLTKSVYDIEDLNKVGKAHQTCPYYLARSKLSNVDIAIIPYHYILTPSIRKKLPLKIENSIVIFDEAHNLERICEEIMSFKLSVEKLKYCD